MDVIINGGEEGWSPFGQACPRGHTDTMVVDYYPFGSPGDYAVCLKCDSAWNPQTNETWAADFLRAAALRRATR